MKIAQGLLAASAAALLVGIAAPASAKLSDAEIARLGADLTPVGAEKAGNKDRTIPARTGGLCAPPAGWTQGKGGFVDPFADEKPLFTITKANAAQYKDKIPTGALAMLNKYPNFSMPVYPSHRTGAPGRGNSGRGRHEARRLAVDANFRPGRDALDADAAAAAPIRSQGRFG